MFLYVVKGCGTSSRICLTNPSVPSSSPQQRPKQSNFFFNKLFKAGGIRVVVETVIVKVKPSAKLSRVAGFEGDVLKVFPIAMGG